MRLTDQGVAQALQIACLLEASTPKPGNVSPNKEFEDLNYRDFYIVQQQYFLLF